MKVIKILLESTTKERRGKGKEEVYIGKGATSGEYSVISLRWPTWEGTPFPHESTPFPPNRHTTPPSEKSSPSSVDLSPYPHLSRRSRRLYYYTQLATLGA